jgi:hypothetical protein
MSKGMWTKNITSDGSIFYFNASLNKSSWKLPPEAVYHEANNLKPLPDSISIDESQRKNIDAMLEFASSLQEGKSDTDATASGGAFAHSSETIPLPNLQVVQEVVLPKVENIDSRIAQAALNKQRQASKRFKPQDTSSSVPVVAGNTSAEYLKIVGELQMAEGTKEGDNSKWHVR